ncbi:MAG: chemotaxis protein CheX [Rhodocyclaceae bacterium]
MPGKKWIAQVVASTLSRTCSYFEEEFGIAVDDVSKDRGNVETLEIHGLTAIVGLGGVVSLLVAYSFEHGLVDALYERMTDGLDVQPDEKEMYRRSVAADVVNTVIGNCTADLPQPDHAISLTPPIILDSVKHIHRMKNAVFISRSLKTKFGCVDINLVGPSELFDSSLNYLK